MALFGDKKKQADDEFSMFDFDMDTPDDIQPVKEEEPEEPVEERPKEDPVRMKQAAEPAPAPEPERVPEPETAPSTDGTDNLFAQQLEMQMNGIHEKTEEPEEIEEEGSEETDPLDDQNVLTQINSLPEKERQELIHALLAKRAEEADPNRAKANTPEPAVPETKPEEEPVFIPAEEGAETPDEETAAEEEYRPIPDNTPTAEPEETPVMEQDSINTSMPGISAGFEVRDGKVIVSAEDAAVNGEIHGDVQCHDLLIGATTVEGNIRSDGVITLSEGAKVNGTIHADAIRVHGTFTGGLAAEKELAVYPDAHVSGTIRAAGTVEIHPGAEIRGKAAFGPIPSGEHAEPVEPVERESTEVPVTETASDEEDGAVPNGFFDTEEDS